MSSSSSSSSANANETCSSSSSSSSSTPSVVSIPSIEPMLTLEGNDGFRIHVSESSAVKISPTLKNMVNPPEGFESSRLQAFQLQPSFLLLWAARYMVYKNDPELSGSLRIFHIPSKVACTLLLLANFLNM